MDHSSLNADKMRSYTTLNSLYHETRQEIDFLNKQMMTKDNIISDLKARLGKFEGLCMAIGDKESVVLGPSKSLVESLCKEICKLKQKRKDVELKASRQAEEIQKLTVLLREKEQELDRVHRQPDHEKEQEIQKLRAALEERERSEATRAVLCTSLAEEADQLRAQLGTTVKVCQGLLSRLDRNKSGGSDVEAAAVAYTEEPASSDVNELKSQIRQLQEENEQLKQRVTYVQGLNSQWQKYDSSREDYIRGLCLRLKETSRSPVGPGLSSVSAGLLHQEISRLNGLLEEKMSECERLSRDVDDVRRQDLEQIQTLKQQVIIYTEDFKSERADRERAQGQLEDLKEQVYQLKRQLHKQGASRDARDLVPVCRVHIGHRISSRRHKDTSEPLLRAAVEAPPPAAAATAAGITAATSSNAAWNNPSELQCPRCFTTFNESDAAEYLNHCEECAKL
ncbi:uncharacterized protein V6R79_005816 [Siganus canaliculatus]